MPDCGGETATGRPCRRPAGPDGRCWQHPLDQDPEPVGAMTAKTLAAVAAARAAGLDPVGEANAQLAIELAKAIDEGATAAVAKELRATLAVLPPVAKEDSPVDDLAEKRAARRAGAAAHDAAAKRVVRGRGGDRTS